MLLAGASAGTYTEFWRVWGALFASSCVRRIQTSHPNRRYESPLATDPKREELRVQQTKAVLVAVLDAAQKNNREHALDELAGLVKTAGVKVVGTMTQVRSKLIPATLLGKGKLEELKLLLDASGADLVVFDNSLSPAQSRNIEKETGRIIVDRSEVILDIFANRARTYEARLQVELCSCNTSATDCAADGATWNASRVVSAPAVALAKRKSKPTADSSTGGSPNSKSAWQKSRSAASGPFRPATSR